MRIEELVRRSAVAIRPDQTVAEAAGIMERAGVGSLAVVDADGRLVGVLTDRDLVRRVMARGLPLDARADGVMTAPVVTVQADEEIQAAYGQLRAHSLRRLAVVRGPHFVGMISIDDLLIELARNLADLTRPIAGEVESAQRDSPLPATA